MDLLNSDGSTGGGGGEGVITASDEARRVLDGVKILDFLVKLVAQEAYL